MLIFIMKISVGSRKLLWPIVIGLFSVIDKVKMSMSNTFLALITTYTHLYEHLKKVASVF